MALLTSLLFAPSAGAQDYSEGHLQAAEELLNRTDMEAILEQSIDAALEVQVQQNPHLAPFEDVMRLFLTKYMSWRALRDPIVRLYAEAFTEEELGEITAFYETETGRKTAELTPMLMARGMALGQQAVVDHLPELEQMLEARARELGGSD